MVTAGQGTMLVSWEGNHSLLPSPISLLSPGLAFLSGLHLMVGFGYFVT